MVANNQCSAGYNRCSVGYSRSTPAGHRCRTAAGIQSSNAAGSLIAAPATDDTVVLAIVARTIAVVAAGTAVDKVAVDTVVESIATELCCDSRLVRRFAGGSPTGNRLAVECKWVAGSRWVVECRWAVECTAIVASNSAVANRWTTVPRCWWVESCCYDNRAELPVIAAEWKGN